MARILDGVVGHQAQIEKLLAAAQAEKLPSTFLFVGPSGVGKKLIAAGLAQALICERSIPACGVCASCLRMAKGQHENFLLIAPERNQIKIEQSRSILDFLSLKALRGRRVILIDGAQFLNPQAANSLLKILEEPQENIFFFLIAPSSEHVLTTIRSRSQIVHFQALTVEQLQKKSKAPEWAIRASLGSFEKLQMLQEENEQVLRNQAKAFLKAWMNEPQGYLRSELRETFKDRSEGSSLSLYLALFLRDAVYFKLGESEKVFNQDQKAFLQELSVLPNDSLIEAAQKALQIPAQLQANRDAALVYEDFWIRSRP